MAMVACRTARYCSTAGRPSVNERVGLSVVDDMPTLAPVSNPSLSR
ncbi:Uncharacterised protein [Bordetella pertussis]|nr:Uncharacterised protein [Bordetella pertussis]